MMMIQMEVKKQLDNERRRVGSQLSDQLKETSSLDHLSSNNPLKQTILYANSNLQLNDFEEQHIRESGFNLESTLDGLDCIDKLRNAEPDLLLLDEDLRWGGSDGVLAWLNEEKQKISIPAVVVMSDGIRRNYCESVTPLVVAHLIKPFALQDMLKCVRTAIALDRKENLVLIERIEIALSDTGYWAFRSIKASIVGRSIILRGSVPSYHLKQIAQATTQAVSDGYRIHNELEVVRAI